MAKILSFFKSYYMGFFFVLLTIISIGYFALNSKGSTVSAQELVTESIQEECNCECEKTDDVLVDIKGAVKKPGVYKLSSNSIVNDVIEAAGGLTKNASTDDINLSKAIYNEMVIYVSTKSELKEKNTTNNVIPSSSSNNAIIDNGGVSNNCNNNSKVNINTASVDDFMSLNGIGEAKAQKIVEYRSSNGPFKSIEDIKLVSGIGDAFYEKIKDYITI